LTWIIAGPICTHIFGGFSADVIRIEQAIDPIRMGLRQLLTIQFLNYINRNKCSMLLNIWHPEGSIFFQLITESDVVVGDFSSGVMESQIASPKTW
jgi:crotonobetainyl-CoA:carnitine CoA-transferase CaiB-like acyl-CoA transferase